MTESTLRRRAHVRRACSSCLKDGLQVQAIFAVELEQKAGYEGTTVLFGCLEHTLVWECAFYVLHRSLIV